jgi:hypothetical protein
MPAGQSPFGPAKTLPSAQSLFKNVSGGHGNHVAPSGQNVFPSAQSAKKHSGILGGLFH